MRTSSASVPGQPLIARLGELVRASGTIARVTQKRYAPVTIEVVAPDFPEAAEILRDYLGEMISRYYGRTASDAEISRHLGPRHGSDDLVEPTGVLLLARRAGDGAPRPVGCAGKRSCRRAA